MLIEWQEINGKKLYIFHIKQRDKVNKLNWVYAVNKTKEDAVYIFIEMII